MNASLKKKKKKNHHPGEDRVTPQPRSYPRSRVQLKLTEPAVGRQPVGLPRAPRGEKRGRWWLAAEWRWPVFECRAACGDGAVGCLARLPGARGCFSYKRASLGSKGTDACGTLSCSSFYISLVCEGKLSS